MHDLFAPPLERALRHALNYLDRLDQSSVAATADLPTLRRQLQKPLQDDGIAPERVIDELVRDVEGGILGSAGGRFFGWVIGGSLPSALAADWLTSAWDQNAGLYACAPAAGVIEEVAGAWLKDIFGLPTESSFAFITGTQMAHATCLAAARNALLARRGWNVEKQGLNGSPSIRILCSSVRHGTLDRAVRFLGLGEQNMIPLAIDEQGRILASSLKDTLAANSAHQIILALQAGDVNIGAFDPFETLIPLAKKYGAWVHIDGAFGLWAAASPRYRHLLNGAELADSWVTDGHKWLNVPYDSGYAFVKDRQAHRAALSHHAAYLTHDADARDELDWNPEHSRRARGIATYAAIRELGRNGIAGLVERCCQHAHSLVSRIGALPGAEALWIPTLNQGLLRFHSHKPRATESDHDARTDEVIQEIVASGEAFFSGTIWRGKHAMRVSVSNWMTSEADVDRVVKAVAQIL